MISKALRDNVRVIVRAYAKATGQSESQISKNLYGNAGFFDRYFSGQQSIRLEKLDQMLDRIVATWPPDARWPMLQVVVMRGPQTSRRGRKSSLSPKKSAAA